MQARKFWVEENGQDLVEYTLLIAFIALFFLGILGTGQPEAISAIWNENLNRLNEAQSAMGGT